MITEDSGKQYIPYYECIHTIKKDDDGFIVEEFSLCRSPAKMGPAGQRVLNVLGTRTARYPEAKAPWTTARYKRMVLELKDQTALIGSGYFAWEDFA